LSFALHVIVAGRGKTKSQILEAQKFSHFSEEKMLSDRASLNLIIDRIETGIINEADIEILRDVITRLDELDDLVDAVCSCRRDEIPILRPSVAGMWDDDAPGRP